MALVFTRFALLIVGVFLVCFCFPGLQGVSMVTVLLGVWPLIVFLMPGNVVGSVNIVRNIHPPQHLPPVPP